MNNDEKEILERINHLKNIEKEIDEIIFKYRKLLKDHFSYPEIFLVGSKFDEVKKVIHERLTHERDKLCAMRGE